MLYRSRPHMTPSSTDTVRTCINSHIEASAHGNCPQKHVAFFKVRRLRGGIRCSQQLVLTKQTADLSDIKGHYRNEARIPQHCDIIAVGGKKQTQQVLNRRSSPRPHAWRYYRYDSDFRINGNSCAGRRSRSQLTDKSHQFDVDSSEAKQAGTS